MTPLQNLPPRLRALLLALVCLAAGVTVTLTITSDGQRIDIDVAVPAQAPAVPATVGVDGPDRDAEPDTVLTLDREAREVAQSVQATPERYDMAGGLRGRDSDPVAPQTGPLATPNFPGCETRILPTNWSGGGHPKTAIGLHYTAGLNRPGKSDMNGLTAYASSPAAGVSWHFLIDAEGHCYYSVPLSARAWTIGNLNRQTVNIEVIGTGRELTYPAGRAGQIKLTSVVQNIGRIYGIPMRVGAVRNCAVTRPGIITHWQGGPCSGGHHDIRPYELEREVAEIRAGGVKPPSKAARRQCQELNGLRKNRPWDARRLARAQLLKRNLTRRRYVCTAGKDGRPGSIRRQ